MSNKFNDTQLVLLSAASQRDDHCLVPPAGPNRGQSQRAVAKLLEAGLLKEIRAKAGAPIWRRDDETGQTYVLKLTATGAKAIAVDETKPPQGKTKRRSDHPPVSVDPKREPGSDPAEPIDRLKSGVARTPTSPRGGTKIAQVIGLLQQGARLSPSLSPPPAGCRTRRGPRSPACASAATPSELIGPTRREDRSIGSSRRRRARTTQRRTLRRGRLVKRRRIGPSALQASEPVGRRDGEAQKSEQRRRGAGPASAIGVRARNARRLGRELFRPQRGSASPPLAKPSGRERSPGSGATIDEIVAATGWLPHTARAALTGLRKRGYAIASDRSDRTRGTVYRIARTETLDDASDAAAATVAADGDNDHVTNADPSPPPVRKRAERTRRAA